MRESRPPCLVPSVLRLLYNYGNRDRFVRLLEKIPLFAMKVSSICRPRARIRYRSNCKWIPCDAFSLSAKHTCAAAFIFDTCLVIFEWKFHYSCFFSQYVLEIARSNRPLFPSREKLKCLNGRYCRRNFWRVFFANVLERDNAWYRITEM